MENDKRKILLNAGAFPVTFRDVDLGVYFIECKIPDQYMDVASIQVFLDNNILGIVTAHPDVTIQKLGWYFSQHPEAHISLNPGIAAAEQYLSNDWDNAKAHLENFEKAVAKFRFFPEGHMLEVLRSVVKNEADTRQQVGTLYCYLTILKYLYDEGPKKGDLVDEWARLFSLDIPRIQVVYLFGSLLLLSKMKRKLRFAHQEAQIMKYADSFLDLRKTEKGNFTRWLRNRTFDILPFIMAPTLSFEQFGGYSSRTIIATNDEVVGECIGRLFAWAGDQQHGDQWYLAETLSTVIDQRDSDIKLAIEQIYRGISAHRPSNPDERKSRLRNLIQITMDMVGEDFRASLHRALAEYRVYDMVV